MSQYKPSFSWYLSAVSPVGIKKVVEDKWFALETFQLSLLLSENFGCRSFSLSSFLFLLIKQLFEIQYGWRWRTKATSLSKDGRGSTIFISTKHFFDLSIILFLYLQFVEMYLYRSSVIVFILTLLDDFGLMFYKSISMHLM